jgi:curved DNA-binding protein
MRARRAVCEEGEAMTVKFEDYYKTLGVERSATQEELQKAFRAKARQYHPDISKEPDAEERFKQINEAYEVLKDPETRQSYDTLGENWKAGQDFTPPPGWGGAGPGGARYEFRGGPGAAGMSDFFNTFFGGGGGGMGGGFGGYEDAFGGEVRRGAPRPREAELTVTLEELAAGAKKSFSISWADPRRPGASQSKQLTVKLPRGATEGTVIRLAGQGETSAYGESGDLHLTLKVAPHERFTLSKHDLTVKLALAPWEAALGASVEVELLEGSLTLKIPAGSSSGRRMRLRGKGLPQAKDKAGDLFVELEVRVPAAQSDEERALWEELARVSGFSAR